ncbi:MAG: hypothetical protein M1839_009311 [Geoglossum umbratile]|nr:MAG: hypothetical protein M1839_009311 [Geoglossum umbratile]
MSNPPAPDSSNPTAKLFSDYVLHLKLGCLFTLLAVRLSSYPYGQQYGSQDFAKRILLLTTFLTDIIKNSVGRPRPDLISRCKPAKGTPEHKLLNIEVCTETEGHTLRDGWRSFPSGHSSFAFGGLGYLAIFLVGQMRVLRPGTGFAKALLALVPLIAAALIAISRCEDYRHDVYDVTVGSLLGFLVAHFSYRRYYPSLRDSDCKTPYASQGEITRNCGFERVDQDEVQLGSVGEEFTVGDVGDDLEASSDEIHRDLEMGRM